jgi:hypothetical protein
MRLAPILIAVALAASSAAVVAKLPPPSDEAKAKAAETSAKGAWSDKVAAYHLCQSMDKVADTYRKGAKSSGKDASSAVATPACTDPGPFVAPTPVAQKPLEASEAHSPAGNATSPPSTNATSSQLTGGPKK